MPLTLSGDGSVGPLSATEVGYLDGVTSAVQTQIDSKLTTPGAWTSWTPTVTSNTGTITSYTLGYCKWTQSGKTVHLVGTVTITNAGTGSGPLKVTLPATPTTNVEASGREVGATGHAVTAECRTDGIAYIQKYDNSNVVVTNYIIGFCATYEAA